MKVLSRKFAFLFVASIAVLTIGYSFASHDLATDHAAAAPCGSPYIADPGFEPHPIDPPLSKVGFVLIVS